MSVTAWVVVCLAAAGLLLNLVGYLNEAEDACADSADVIGESGWSWFPPGETCAYQVTTSDGQPAYLTTNGSWYLVWTMLLLVTCVMLLLRFTRARSRTGPANWYVDPHDDQLLRYWDGRVWTEHTAPRTHEGHEGGDL